MHVGSRKLVEAGASPLSPVTQEGCRAQLQGQGLACQSVQCVVYENFCFVFSLAGLIFIRTLELF